MKNTKKNTKESTCSTDLGECIITGFSGMDFQNGETKEIENAIMNEHIGGILLFSNNFKSPAQVAELINGLQSCVNTKSLPLWVSVDQEGGKVQRFNKRFTIIPEAFALAKNQSPKAVFEVSSLMARELRAVGVNMNFAPVADINTNPKNPIIGKRAFGTTESETSPLVTAFVRGHLKEKVQPVVKHFPGHGDTRSDSHFTLPKVVTEMKLLRQREFKPFVKAFKAGCQAVMTAHIMVPEIDREYPATLSKRFMTDILREELGFEGLIISDDLEMQAITKHFGPEEAAILAMNAGCDLLIYKTLSGALYGLNALRRALDDGRLDVRVAEKAIKRSRQLKRKLLGTSRRAVKVQDLSQCIPDAKADKVIANIAAESGVSMAKTYSRQFQKVRR